MNGVGVFSGKPATVTITPGHGPTTLGRGSDRAPIGSLRIVGRDGCSVAILPSGRELSVVEHVLSAVAGAHAFSGAHIDVDGDELPLLDGGAARYFDALAAAETAPLHVRSAARAEAHGTTLTVEPYDGIDIAVEVDFPPERFGVALRGTARWTGDRDDYRRRVATARTFGAMREGRHGPGIEQNAGAIVALDDPRARPSDPEEPIRHKLLDAIGDLATLGAPLRGRVRIHRPSHRGTLAALSLLLTQPASPLGR